MFVFVLQSLCVLLENTWLVTPVSSVLTDPILPLMAPLSVHRALSAEQRQQQELHLAEAVLSVNYFRHRYVVANCVRPFTKHRSPHFHTNMPSGHDLLYLIRNTRKTQNLDLWNLWWHIYTALCKYRRCFFFQNRQIDLQ